MANEALRARLVERVAEALAGRPDDGVTLSVAGCDEGDEGAVLLRVAAAAAITAGDTRVPRAVDGAIRAALRGDPSLRALTIDVRVDAAG